MKTISVIHIFVGFFFQGKKKGQKSNRNKKSNKSKNNLRKSNKKSNVPYAGNDLSAKLYSTMEKHKEVGYSEITFFFLCKIKNSKIYKRNNHWKQM